MEKVDAVNEGLKWIQKCDVINILAEMIQSVEGLETASENWDEKMDLRQDIETLKWVVEKVDCIGGKTPDDILMLYSKGGVCNNAGTCPFFSKSETDAEKDTRAEIEILERGAKQNEK